MSGLALAAGDAVGERLAGELGQRDLPHSLLLAPDVEAVALLAGRVYCLSLNRWATPQGARGAVGVAAAAAREEPDGVRWHLAVVSRAGRAGMMFGMGLYRQVIPLAATDEEREQAMAELAELYADMREGGDDVIVGVTPTSDGDEYVFGVAGRELQRAA